MKNRNLQFLLVLTILGQFLFACNSAKHFEFTNNTQSYHSPKVQPKADPADLQVKGAGNEEVIAKTETVPANLSADAGKPEPAVNIRKTEIQEYPIPAEITRPQQFPVSKSQKKEVKTALKQLKKQVVQDSQSKPTVDIIELILAIFLPPIGVLLHEDGLNARFWIALLLTLLFFFPGMIYAILVVTDII